MPVIKSEDAEMEAVLEVARLMVSAARTAPKGRGEDRIATAIVYGEEKQKLAKEMHGLTRIWYTIQRDARNVKESQAVVLIGVKAPETSGKRSSSGRAADERCIYDMRDSSAASLGRGFDELAPCGLFLIDLGIAVGSAAKIASDMNVDNRVMVTIGVAAKRLGLLDAAIIIGIPLSIAGKNPYFDRKWWYLEHRDYYLKDKTKS